MDVLNTGDSCVEIMLPSGNRLVMHYFGEGEADHIMVHSFDSGDGDSPMNLDLIVPDPDSILPEFGDSRDVHDVHRVRVRHHGPADSGLAFIPLEFLDQEEGQDE